MQKECSLKPLQGLQPEETIRRMHWKRISYSLVENFLLFHISLCNWAKQSTKVLLKIHILDGQFICITLTFANIKYINVSIQLLTQQYLVPFERPYSIQGSHLGLVDTIQVLSGNPCPPEMERGGQLGGVFET